MQVRRNHHGKETLEEGEEVGIDQAVDQTASLVSKCCALWREVLERKMESLRDCGGSFFLWWLRRGEIPRRRGKIGRASLGMTT
jgi:hypothetical protein